MIKKSNNTIWHHATITRHHREKLNQHKSVIVWFTGLSGAGKSTLAHAVEEKLYHLNCRTFVLDGDNIRHGICNDLDFSNQDRQENIRRIGEIAKIMMEAGTIILTAFISPFAKERQLARQLVAHGEFIEIYCHCALDICEKRDVKGMYSRARAGKIKNFTGISSDYEPPKNPELRIDTGCNELEYCVDQVLLLLVSRGIITF